MGLGVNMQRIIDERAQASLLTGGTYEDAQKTHNRTYQTAAPTAMISFRGGERRTAPISLVLGSGGCRTSLAPIDYTLGNYRND